MDAKVHSVRDVFFALTRSMPPALLLRATGVVSTGGWSNPRLVPRVYVVPPSDGIWDFDFIATAPTPGTITTQGFVAHTAEEQVFPAPKWIRGVRVHASTNEVNSGEESGDLALSVKNWVPFPWGKGSGSLGAVLADDRFVPFPWLKGPTLASGDIDDDPGDAFPWSLPDDKPEPRKTDNSLLDAAIGTLIGAKVRVFREGELITMDYVSDRVNVVLARYSDTIQDIWMG